MLPESPEGGLSVHIFALSPSASSMLMLVLYRLEIGRVDEVARGDWWRPSMSWNPVRGARRLGRRNRSINGLRSSAETASCGRLAGEVVEGSANSLVDVGSDGRRL